MSSSHTAKLKLKIPIPRNPFVALAMKRSAGSHRKSDKSLRRSDKVKTLKSLRDQVSFPEKSKKELNIFFGFFCQL